MTRLARLLAGAVLWLATAGLAVAGPASDTVERFHALLLGVMKEATTLGGGGRFARIEPALGETFDLATMIRIASGVHWNAASPAQREALTAAFGRMSAATYASHFDGWSGESFATLGEEAGPGGTVVVRTRIQAPGEAGTSLAYVLRETADRWRVVNILLDTGISELAVRRSEYAAILSSEGPDGLVRQLNAKADVLLGK